MGQEVHLLSTAHRERQPIVVSRNYVVQQRSLALRYGLAPSLLDQKTQSSGLVQGSQFALVIGRTHATEYTVALNENLTDVNHQTSSVSQSLALSNPLNNCSPVLQIFTGRSQVPRTEYLRLVLDEAMVVGNDPVIIYRSQFLHLLLHSVIVDSRGSRTEDRNQSVDLRSQSVSNQLVRICFPDREDAANCEVSVNNRTAVQRVKGHHVSLSLPDNLINRSLLTSKGLHFWIFPEVSFDDLIAVDVLMELGISEEILRFQDDDGRMSEVGGDLLGSVED